MGTGTAASSIRQADTRRSDSGGVLRRRGPSARSTGKRPYASQVVPLSRSPWCAAPRPGGAVPQAIGRLRCALDTVHGFRDLRTARTALGSGHPPGRRAVRHPPRCNEALPSGRASALAGLRRRASSTCASPAGCRRERVRAASSTATCCISTASYRSPAPRTRGPRSTSCSVEAACEPPPHGTCRPACGHILPRGPFWRARVGPLVPCTNSSERRFIPPRPTGGRRGFIERYVAPVTSDGRFDVCKMAGRGRRLGVSLKLCW